MMEPADPGEEVDESESAGWHDPILSTTFADAAPSPSP
jgi:hypothetical protein